MLELVSDSMSSRLGFHQPLLTVTQFLNILAAMTLISALFIHFLYRETIAKAEQDGIPHSLWEVVSHYKHFFQPKYRMCRQAITSLLTYHGLIYFGTSYSIQLIKNHNFSKQLLTNLGNVCLIPIFLLTYILSRYWTDPDKIHSRIRIILGCKLTVMVVIFTLDITETMGACIALVILNLLTNTHFFLNSLINNSFSLSKFAGTYVTMMASVSNFGQNSTIQLEAIDKYGYRNACMFGFLYTLIVVGVYGKVEAWIKRGEEDCDMESKGKKSS